LLFLPIINAPTRRDDAVLALVGHTGPVRSVAFGELDGHPVVASGGADRLLVVALTL
jgi:hypothetical protein